MGIRLPAPPADALTVLADTMADLESADPRRDVGGAPLRVAPHPLPLYNLPLASIRRGAEPVRGARQVGWRYLIERDGSPAVADLHGSPSGKTVEFGRVASGPPAARLVARANDAELLGAGHSDDFEARILEVPALHITAFWLEADEPLFLLVTPDTPAEPMSAASFRAYLIEAATRYRDAARRQP